MQCIKMIFSLTNTIKISDFAYGKKAPFCKGCEVKEVVTSPPACLCLTIDQWWQESPKDENPVRWSKNLSSMFGFHENGRNPRY